MIAEHLAQPVYFEEGLEEEGLSVYLDENLSVDVLKEKPLLSGSEHHYSRPLAKDSEFVVEDKVPLLTPAVVEADSSLPLS